MRISSFALSRKLRLRRIPYKQAQTTIYVHTKNLIFAKMKLSSFARRFIANGVSHKLLSQQSLMPMFHSTETSSRLNGISSDTHSPLHLSRRLAFMVADFGSAFKYSACPTVPQSDDYVVTAPEVSLQPVAQGMPPELAEPTRE